MLFIKCHIYYFRERETERKQKEIDTFDFHIDQQNKCFKSQQINGPEEISVKVCAGKSSVPVSCLN